MAMPLACQEANIGGTLVLLEAARVHPVKRFVLVSSSTVYGASRSCCSATARSSGTSRTSAFAGDMPVTCADLTKAERLLGYQPRVSLAEGVRDFVAWFRRQK